MPVYTGSGVPGSTEVQLPTVIRVMAHFYRLLCPPSHIPPSLTSISWEHSWISYDPSDHVSGSASGWGAQTKIHLLTLWLFALSFPSCLWLSCKLLKARGIHNFSCFFHSPPQNLRHPINSNQNHLLIHEYFQTTDIEPRVNIWSPFLADSSAPVYDAGQIRDNLNILRHQLFPKVIETAALPSRRWALD